jgi:terminase large subunit-like protein
MPTIKPNPGPQTNFLASSADLVFYGGAAGGGKSYALLLDPLRYLCGPTAVPGFTGVIFRRTSPELTNPGGLWDTSFELYSQVPGAVPRVGMLDWTFPPHGNRMVFHHLQHPTNVHSWQGSQVTYFGWDEITHFTEAMFVYVTFSRGRSQCDVEAYSRASCNPHPGWVKSKFLAPWVDKEFKGVRADPGEHRYFIRAQDDTLKWVDKGTQYAQSITFIPSKVTDNPVMLKRNPGYIGKLMAMPRVERERLLEANWDVHEEGLVYPEAFDPELDVIVECEGPRGGVADEGGMDFGLTAPFVALWGYTDYDDVMWFTGERYIRGVTIPEHSKAIPKDITWHADPAGAQEIAQLRQAGHNVRPCVHIPTRGSAGEVKHPVRSGIDMVRNRMRTGRLKIVRAACPNLVRELGLYINDPEKPDSEEPLKADDHAPDGMRYRVVGHDRHGYVPPLAPPETANERQFRELSEAKADMDRRRALDADREKDLWNDAYFGNP